jgi:hypothetical protein
MKSDLFISHLGQVYQLVFSDQVLLLSANDAIAFDAQVAEKTKWTFTIVFAHDDSKKPLAINSKVATDKTIEIHLNKWYSNTWVETSNPLVFKSEAEGIEILVKIRTICNAGDLKHRLVFINVWKKYSSNGK